jgi:hypothetical protein
MRALITAILQHAHFLPVTYHYFRFVSVVFHHGYLVSVILKEVIQGPLAPLKLLKCKYIYDNFVTFCKTNKLQTGHFAVGLRLQNNELF